MLSRLLDLIFLLKFWLCKVQSECLILKGGRFEHNTYNMHLKSLFSTAVYIFYEHMLQMQRVLQQNSVVQMGFALESQRSATRSLIVQMLQMKRIVVSLCLSVFCSICSMVIPCYVAVNS